MASLYGEQTDIFVRQNENEDFSKVAFMKVPEGVDHAIVMRQLFGRKVAKDKLPSFFACEDIAYPVKLSMEQCSSELTAVYKQKVASSFAEHKEMVDLTAGFGVDFFFISRLYEKATYVERNEELHAIATHNFNVLGARNVITTNNDASQVLDSINGKISLIFLDPARRDKQGRKTVEIEDCEPNVLELKDKLLEKAENVMIKFSPMLDIKNAVRKLECVSEVHVVSVDGECKELLLVLKRDCEKMKCFCVNLGRKEDTISFFADENNEDEITYSTPLKYIYEPNASLMKIGAHGVLAKKYSIYKIAPFSHLFTSDTLVETFAGRRFEVKSVFQMNKKELKESLKGISKANIAVRNFPLTAEELKKKLKLKDGGEEYIFGTTLQDNKHVLILCKKA